MFASVKNGFVAGDDSPMPNVLRVYSAKVPKPKPAAKPPKEAIRPIREDGTVRCLDEELSYQFNFIVK